MADIEKVIKAFECCDAYYNKQDLTGHERCPYNGRNGGEGCNQLYEDTLELLKSQPQIVRCKECKHLGYTSSHWFCKLLNRCVDEDWFCADGDRKEQFRKGSSTKGE